MYSAKSTHCSWRLTLNIIKKLNEKGGGDKNSLYLQKCLQAKEEQEKKEKELRKTTPHFWNLNEDSQLSGKIHHLIKQGKSHYGLQFRTKHSQVLSWL